MQGASRAVTADLLRRRFVGVVVVLSLVVAIAGCVFRPNLVFSPTTLPDAHVGQPYSVTITVSQAATPVGGASVSTGSLPAGLRLTLREDPHDNTMTISGTPTAAGSFDFSIDVWCYGTNVAGQTATQPYTLVVK